ncbi:site-2 protease family protein [Porphyrobacter sp. GA68]|uniref:site-2 protease family protein n=1 Tax=Porphyrobacter sp. GA68 TaxID=2883480 RepID=UPI001D18A369|nr:site-2 protease family protein [Porphyrobacter sp. GA68]
MSDTIMLALILVPSLIIAIVFHEVAHGWVANALGDPTAREQRRLSLNPLRHVDPVGTLVVPGLLALAKGPIFGWAKPVPVVKDRLRNPRWGMVAVAAAGPGTNFILGLVGAVLLGAVLKVLTSGNGSVWMMGLANGLEYFIIINIFIALFNLLPIPPFDGSHIVEGILPEKAARQYERLRPVGMVFFFGLVALTWFAPQLGVIENVILPPVEWLHGRYMQVVSAVAG